MDKTTKSSLMKVMLAVSGIATLITLIGAIICYFIGVFNDIIIEISFPMAYSSVFLVILFVGSLGVFICSSIVKNGCNCCNGFTIFYCVCGVLGCMVITFICTMQVYFWFPTDDLTSDTMQYNIEVAKGMLEDYKGKEGFLDYYKQFTIQNNCCGIAAYNDTYGVGSIYASSACDNASASTTPFCSLLSLWVIYGIIGSIVFLIYSIMACMYGCKKEDKKLEAHFYQSII
ncbi:hypothetical protein WA158_000474 [Blastocystis sp. Blastoise]